MLGRHLSVRIKRKHSVLFLLLFVSNITLFSNSVFAAEEVPTSFTYQGRFYDATGSAPIANGTYNIRFGVYDSSGNCLLYEESQNITTVSGFFSSQVGSPLASGKRTVNDPGLSMRAVFANEQKQVRPPASPNCAPGYMPAKTDLRLLKVENVTLGVALTPDQMITSVPYALVAESLNGLGAEKFLQYYPAGVASAADTVDAGTLALDGVDFKVKRFNGTTWVDHKALSPESITQAGASSGQVLKWNGATWAPATDDDSFASATAGGDVSGSYGSLSVVGLRGRPVSASAPSTNQVLTWDGSNWVPANAVAVPTGAAGGDLVGNYPNPYVGRLIGAQVTSSALSAGQVLKYDGTSWVAGVDSTAPTGAAGGDLDGTYPNPTVDALQGVAVSAAAPVAGYVLRYDGTQWSPYNLAGVTNNFLQKSGDSMSGVLEMGANINMNGNTLTGLPTPLLNSDAVNLEYVQTQLSGLGSQYVRKTGDTMSGYLQTMSSVHIDGVVGIGTTTPSSKLQIDSPRAGIDHLILRDTIGLQNARFYMTVPGGTGPDLNIHSDRVRFPGFAINTNRIETQSGSLLNLVPVTVQFGHGSATNLQIAGSSATPTIQAAGSNANVGIAIMPKGTGNVGIGTASPEHLLHVNGAARIASTLDMSGARIVSVGNPTGSADAINKLYADTKLGGLDLDTSSLSTGQVLKWNGTYWYAANDAGAAGVLTEVQAGAGLVPNTITSSGIIEIDPAYFNSSYVKKSGDTMSGYLVISNSLNIDGNILFPHSSGTRIIGPTAYGGLMQLNLSGAYGRIYATNENNIVYTTYSNHLFKSAQYTSAGGTNLMSLDTEWIGAHQYYSSFYDGKVVFAGFVSGGGAPTRPLAYFNSIHSTQPTIVARAATSQTADLQQWQNSTGTTLSVVNSNGYFGIGTNAPDRTLVVNGATKIASTLDMSGERIVNLGMPVDGNDGVPRDYLTDTAANLASVYLKKAGDTMSGYLRAMSSVHIDGNVGIGTANPITPLHIVVPSNSSALAITDPGGGYGVSLATGPGQGGKINFTQISGQNSIRVAGTDQMSFDGSQIALGADITVQSRSIRGTDNGSTAQGLVQIRGGNAANLNDNGGDVRIYGGTPNGTGSNGNIVLGHTGAVARGYVGIGTTTPDRALVVNGAARIGSTLDMSGARIVNLGYPTDTADAASKAYVDAVASSISGGGNYVSKSGDTITGLLRATSSMIIDGNVGIGTTTPGELLSVNKSIADATASIIAEFHANNSVVTGGVLKVSANRSDVSPASRYSAIQSTDGGGTARALVLNPSGGNVGIGTTSPGRSLEVALGGGFRLSGTNGNYMEFTNGSVYHSLGFDRTIVGGSSNDFTLYTGAGTDMRLYTGGSERLRILSTGNIGIGTTTADEMLTVAGNVKATSFISTSDARLKTDIKKAPGLESLTKISGYQYNWLNSGDGDAGVIAQEVESVFPDAVRTDSNGYKSVKYNYLIAPLIQSTKELYGMCQTNDSQIKEIKRSIASIQSENEKLKLENKELRERLERIEKKLGIK